MRTCWNRSKVLLQERLDLRDYRSWIEPIEYHGYEQGELKLKAPNKFIKKWFSDHYVDLAVNVVKEVSGKEVRVHIGVDAEAQKTQMDFSDKLFPHLVSGEETPEDVGDRPQIIGNIIKDTFTFNRFVTGPSNEFAKASAQAVANNPGKAFNPLFIYGGTGLGKTHLLGAIANQIMRSKKQAKPMKIAFVSFERFTNEWISSIHHGRYNAFRKKYRDIDVLLIDDIQFIAGKERTQAEFFHTFNHLYESGSQIVMTSDKFPRDIPGLEERLWTRFSWGLLVDIQPPELETRVAILKRRAREDNYELPDDVAFFLASHFTTNVRELEGALIRLQAFTSLGGQAVTLDLAKQVLRHVVGDLDKPVTVEQVQKTVCDFFHVKLGDLKSPKKSKSITFPRQVAMYLSRQLTDASFPDIGSRFGGKDHTTVMYAVRKIEEQSKQDPDLLSNIETLVKTIKKT
jgi:chromosomal replication initiator protein